MDPEDRIDAAANRLIRALSNRAEEVGLEDLGDRELLMKLEAELKQDGRDDRARAVKALHDRLGERDAG